MGSKKSIENQPAQKDEIKATEQPEALYQELSIREVEDRMAFAAAVNCDGCT